MKVLGIDCGSKYIGLALGIDDIVSPLGVKRNSKDIAQEILKTVNNEKPDVVAIGYPESQSETPPKYLLNFRTNLDALLNGLVDIEYVDERYSSKDALEKSLNAGIGKSVRSMDHSIAACEIIHRYFEKIQENE